MTLYATSVWQCFSIRLLDRSPVQKEYISRPTIIDGLKAELSNAIAAVLFVELFQVNLLDCIENKPRQTIRGSQSTRDGGSR